MQKELTVTFKGVEFDVSFDYDHGEPEIRYDSNMEGHPGYSPEITGINWIRHQGTDFIEFFDDLNLWDDLDKMLLEEI